MNKLQIHRLLLIVILSSSICLSSCEKEEETTEESEYPEYVIFGKYTSNEWCNDETCIEMFKITTNGLYEDLLDNSPIEGQTYYGNFASELSQADYDFILDVLEGKSYQVLFEQEDASLGNLFSSNTHFYFEYKSKTIHKAWLIDGSFDGSLPAIVQPFMLELNQIVSVAQF